LPGSNLVVGRHYYNDDDFRRRFSEIVRNRLQWLGASCVNTTEEEVDSQIKSTRERPVSKRVFVVHGHNEAALSKVARFLEHVGLDPVVLHEQPNKGRTIIEKFEAHSDVAFAVVLLTGDDVGYANRADAQAAKPRARQNVILELGYFLGKLGRERVCPLCEEGLETPSDYDGVVYVPLDAAGAWQMSLGRELREAHLPVDLNQLG